MKTKTMRERLLASTVLLGALAVATAGHAADAIQTAPTTGAQAPVATAQDSTQTPASMNAGSANSDGANGGNANTVREVVVTGSLIQRNNLAETIVPLTTLNSQELNQRGITTVTNALQSIADNGAGTLTSSWTGEGGAFAAGASSASLRGLDSSRTLVLIDGLRTAYYPLSDDGLRSFVDLNTIPDIILDRVDVQKDGGSATYGADAVAGVVNVITKKTFEGMQARAEGGWAQQGGASSNTFQGIIGHGNLGRDGYNVYVAAEYEHDDDLYANQRGYPFNSSDQSRNCGIANGNGAATDASGNPLYAAGSRICAENFSVNGLQFNGGLLGVSGTTVPIFRAISNVNGQPIGNYTLAPGANCGALSPITYTAANLAAYAPTGVSPGTTLCQQDLINQYQQFLPDDHRLSLALRGTKTVNDNMQAYIAANYYENTVVERTTPETIRQTTTPGQLGETYSTSSTLNSFGFPAGLLLPAVLSNGTLNPNDPFAAQGEDSSIRYRFGDIPSFSRQYDRVYRINAGVNGTFNLYGDWHYSLDLTGTENYLTNDQNGYPYVANLLTAVANGSYNFINPSANTAAVRNFVAPLDVQKSESKLYQMNAVLSHDLYQLPGGPLTVAVIGTARYESIYDPSANPDVAGDPTQKYFNINPFGVIGSRTTEAVGYEIDAPIIKQFEIDTSGRYDTYSTGQSHFSPKIDGKFTPIKYVTFRSSYSQGFRIPNFAESNSLPTTGFIGNTAPASFQALHGNDGYGVNYSYGATTSGTGGLKPETSENFTAGLVFNPIRELSFSMDYYRIKIRNVIQTNTAGVADAIAAYYAGTPLPTGYKAIPSGDVDSNFPTAQPELGFLQYGFVNAGVQTTSGYDFGATANFRLPFGVHYTSSFDGNYILSYNLFTDGTVQHYAGSLGPGQLDAAGGTPKFRANWQNTLTYGPASVTLTTYFTDGFQDEAEDFGGTIGDCAGSAVNTGYPVTYLDGATPIVCKSKPFWDEDLHVSYDVKTYINFQIYLDVQNLFNKPAPYDPSASYGVGAGGNSFNNTFDTAGIIGRVFKVGARASF